MSSDVWDEFPVGFLKMKYQTWRNLSHGVRQLIGELAEKQKFKCALCSKERDLIIEHDRNPEEGPGHRYTVYNIRGLACSRCNFHLMLYEKQENGDYINWEHSYPDISSYDYDDYIWLYECRVCLLVQAAQEKRIGCRNFLYRRRVLEKFDKWYHKQESAPPLWIQRYREQQSEKIETADDAIRILTAIFQFMNEQFEKDPSIRGR